MPEVNDRKWNPNWGPDPRATRQAGTPRPASSSGSAQTGGSGAITRPPKTESPDGMMPPASTPKPAQPATPSASASTDTATAAKPTGNTVAATVTKDYPLGPNPNASRVAKAKGVIDAARKEANGARIDAATADALLKGVEQPRGTTLSGAEGILGVVHVQGATNALLKASPKDAAAFAKLIQAASGKSQQTQRAYLLKVAAAHGITAATVKDFSAFAQAMAPMSRQQLIDRCTFIDLNQGDGKSTGLKQRLEGSCTTTTMQLARGEVDPVGAFASTKSTVLSDYTKNDALKAEQKKLLEKYGGGATDRGVKEGAGGVMPADIDELADEVLTRSTHRDYDFVDLRVMPQKQVKLRFDQMRELLEDGVDVPIGVDTLKGAGWATMRHAMLMTDVRTDPSGETMYLVQDPWNGRSYWVKESLAMAKGFDLEDFANGLLVRALYLSKPV